MSDDEKPLDLEAARALAQVRRLMMIASVTTFVAVAVVLGVIGYLTAQGRQAADEQSLFVFNRCKLTADPGVAHVWLGRPWRPMASVVFLDTEMGAHIATIPLSVIRQMLHHPLTDLGLERFLADWHQTKQKI